MGWSGRSMRACVPRGGMNMGRVGMGWSQRLDARLEGAVDEDGVEDGGHPRGLLVALELHLGSRG